MNQRQLFQQHIAQTSDAPLMLEPSHAEGVKIYDTNGKEYIDLIAGISVSNLGHSNPKIVNAINQQAQSYMHLMVYGEFVEAPQVQFAKTLTEQLPKNLNAVYFTNSGAEATEGALKLAKRYTGRSEIVYFKHSYHGSTMGALSVLGDEFFKQNYRPLIPNCRMLNYGNIEDLNQITQQTAAVIIEPIQAESGITQASDAFWETLQKQCKKTGTLLIVDEAQTGLGRTGSLYRCLAANITPDILLTAKAFGGGMPLGAFISSQQIFEVLQNNPVLGHITTFGGHPVCCAAGLASLNILLQENYINQVEEKGQLFKQLLKHPAIKNINGLGLFLSLEFESYEFNKQVIDACLEMGLITDWFLFAPNYLRIAPPLIITAAEIKQACTIILNAINKVVG